MSALKAGDLVTVNGRTCVYLGPKGQMAEISFNGRSELVAPAMLEVAERLNGSPPPLAEEDPFADMVGQFKDLISKLEKRRSKALDEAANLKGQIARLERVLSALGTAAPAKKRVSHQWTDEQRAAAGERMRARQAAKKQETTA